MGDSIHDCVLCGRACHALRTSTRAAGYCRCTAELQVCLAKPHFGEEPCLSGTRGSGAIFFGGCGLGCVFCQNYAISSAPTGKTISPARLAEIFQELEARGVHNINLVSPTQYVYQIAEALTLYRPKIPVVYNTSGYDSPEALRCMDGLADVYLPDYKLASPDRAKRYLHAANYPAVAEAALLEMRRQQPADVFDENGLLQRGVLVRHLVLPCNLDETRAVLNRIAQLLGTGTLISLMGQYIPMGRVNDRDFHELNRTLTAREYRLARQLLLDLGFENGFIQERSSAKPDWVPVFNLEGV